MRQSFVRLLPVLCALWLATVAWASEASDLYKKGRKAEKAGHIAQAYLLYSEAAALEPGNHLYWSRTEALRTRAALETKVSPQLAAALAELDKGPTTSFDPVTPEDLADARKPLPPNQLKATPGRKDFRLHANSKTLFETVAHAFGLDCVFDGDYQAGQTIRFKMDQADYHEALHALEAATGSFIIPVSDRLFMVAKDTTQKRQQEEPFAALIVSLPEPTTLQDLTGLITAVQQACDIKKVAWDSQKNIVVLRDTVAKIIPARQLFEDLLYPRAQVQFDLEFLELSTNDMLNYGLALPTSFPTYWLTTVLNNAPQIASNIAGLLLFGGGESLIGLGIANAQLLASFTNSNATILLHASARSIEGQPATIHVGQKYPILTAGYFGPANFSGPGAYTPPPSFTFEDLGLTLKATTHVQGTDELTLAIESEFKVLTGTASNGIPVISNRSLKSTVTLRMDEWAVIAGLMDDQDARTVAGIVGVNNLPIIGPLTRNVTRNRQSDQVVILLKPTLLTPPADQVVTHMVRFGAENRPLTRF